ncbi:2,3,4,5-tetrahydropyridine-2,6-dicarboxylate N-succinyltransferase [Parvularcula dongshanensis]|uniref:2,3,4,5-tetrahydropyridine-2,6-dicarboxylate N-succinyltransferase n=1 Tax=Parvularcula dongshanensis TaxID=1173995 RepID=UPI0031B5EC95
MIEAGWENRTRLDDWQAREGDLGTAVETALAALDDGRARVAEPDGQGGWTTHQWLKKAVLLSFRLESNALIKGGPGGATWWDKVPMKTAGWSEREHAEARFRAVPPCAVRHGAYIAPGAVLMPSYVNIGAHVGAGTMIDTWATVGSCAQVGERCHVSGGTGIGGVLEPLQANPTIIEDDVFLGARSEVAEGVIVRRGAVIAMGVFLGASTKIVDRETGEVFRGEVPEYAVVVPGALPSEKGGPSLACAVIVKRVDERTRAKTSVNELLRD